MNAFVRFCRDRCAATSVEYGLLVCTMALAALAIVRYGPDHVVKTFRAQRIQVGRGMAIDDKKARARKPAGVEATQAPRPRPQEF